MSRHARQALQNPPADIPAIEKIFTFYLAHCRKSLVMSLLKRISGADDHEHTAA